MIRKSILIALAATATLGAAMLSTTAADAYRGGFCNHGNHGFYHRYNNWHRPFVRWHRPIIYAAPVAYAVSRPVAAAPTCNCLTKEYTPEGAVLFKDNCTNEMAMNPPEGQQQTGMNQPQPQQMQPQAQAYTPQYPPQTTR